jgi:LacI family transcriptional regulator
MMKRARLTIRDLAQAAGVSVGTASNAMALKPSVSVDLRDRVMRAAAEIGYSPNALAAGLRRQSTRTIGLCIPNFANPFFSDLAQQFNIAVEQAGYDVLIVETRENAGHERKMIDALYSRQVDGICIVPTAGWQGAHVYEVPLIVVDRIRQTEPLPSVAMDNAAAVVMAFDALHALGHRNIWMVVNSGALWNSTLRVEGFRRAAQSHGLSDQVHVVDTSMDPQEIAAELGRALEQGSPSAILSANGLATLGTLRALQVAGLSAPRDVSLLAIDDAVWMDVLRPSISVVRQPVADIAAAAWAMMVNLLSGTEVGTRHVELLPTLILRESTGELRSPRPRYGTTG